MDDVQSRDAIGGHDATIDDRHRAERIERAGSEKIAERKGRAPGEHRARGQRVLRPDHRARCGLHEDEHEHGAAERPRGAFDIDGGSVAAELRAATADSSASIR